MPDLGSRSRNLLSRRLLWSGAFCGWLFCSLAAWWVAEHSAARIDREARSAALARVEVAAEAVQQNMLRLLEAVHGLYDLAQTRQNLVAEHRGTMAVMLEQHLASVAEAGRFGLLQVGVIGADGWLAWSSVPGWDRVYLGDREHFTVHLNRPPALFVSKPLVGRASGRWSVQFTRPLQSLTGGFGGVVVVSIDPLKLSEDLALLRKGTEGSSLLLREDGGVLAYSHDVGPLLGKSLGAKSALFQLHSARPAGSFETVSIIDGRPKFVGFRKLAEAPIIVCAAMDVESEMAATAFVAPSLRVAAAAFAALLLATMALGLLWLDRRRALRDLKRARRENEAAMQRLSQSDRMEALGRLAGGIAHDFNNILQAVLGGTKLISRRSKDAAQVERLARMITEAAERGASVSRRLLTFARRAELHATPVQVGELLAGLHEILSHTLGPSVQVRLSIAPDLPPALLDRGQLETVLINLAVNARDAMEPMGGGQLTLAVSMDTLAAARAQAAGLRSGPYLRLEVADTGIGMDAATLGRAMEPFFTTKPKGKGTGLGLAMAKGFAEQSGGMLVIDSQPRRGTIVRLWLPVPEIPVPEVPASGPAPGAPLTGQGDVAEDPAEAPAETPTGRLLLVDDEASLRETLAACLREQGHAVLEAESGVAALAQLSAARHIDILVTDLAMPGMDGLALLDAVRQRLPALPALLFTGFAGDASVAAFTDAARSGPFAVLRKPASPDAVIAQVGVLLAASRVHGPQQDRRQEKACDA
ncbi:response regulator [Teichococcus aestuarii]|uniref:response regulator n=1 Tax=Teichococcus aestuarii TaxID=568898 RepID=UPI00361D9FB1